MNEFIKLIIVRIQQISCLLCYMISNVVSLNTKSTTQ